MSTVTVSKYGADLADQVGNVQPHVLEAAKALADKFGLTSMSGYRASNTRDVTGHPAGLALDIPASRTTGDAVAAYVTANAAAFAVKYVIWQQRIWYPGKGWEAMAARTGAGDVNHERHVHVSFTATPPGGGGSLLERLAGGVGSVVTGAADALNPFADWPAQATGIALKIAGVLAGLGLLVLGANRLVQPAIQGAVTKAAEVIT